ncbi:MAG: hypothetical protein IPP68_01935 [Elusimicrobia bacterium]|nr:hypothetical protein [Elusimicrobiota bacterium]
MTIKRAIGWLAGIVVAMGASPAAATVSISGTVVQSSTISASPSGVALMVSTFPVTDPALANDPSVFIASAPLAVIGSAAFSFPTLPFFGNPTEYYLYAYRDLNSDGVPGSTEPMGGFGPFPFNDPAGHWTAPVDSVSTAGVTINLIPRAEVTGQLFNNSAQSGQRLIVRAIDLAHPAHKWQTIEFPVGGGPFPYSLGGLVPTLNYTVEAWLDTQPTGSTGAYNPEPFEDKALSQGPYAAQMGITSSNVDLTISSGALGGSTPDHVRLSGMNDSWSMTISSGAASGDLAVSVRDFNDALTATGTPTALIFTGFDAGGPFVPQLSTDAFATTFTTAALPGGQPFSGKFKFRYPGQGNLYLQVQAVNFPTVGESRFAYFSFNVLPGGAGFSNLNARTTTDPATATGTATAITPDRDGVDDAAVLSCDPPDPGIYWECDLSTETSFTTGVVSRFFGSGPGEVYWYGSGFDGRTVPNGTYFARFQTEGAGLVSSTLAVTVNTAFVRGTATDLVFSPVADANIQVNGPGGGGFARSANDGSFFVGGLVAGQSYNVDLSRPGFAPQNFAVVASSDVGNVVLGPGATLRVKATVDVAPPFDLYGNIFVHDASYSSVAGGPLHLAPGNTVSDNGLPAADSNFSNFTSLAIKPGVAYTVEIDLPQYGHFTVPGQSTGPGQTVDVVQAMFRKANIAGTLNFPGPLSSPFGGEWVSVDAVPTVPAGASPAAWGGAFVSNGASSATYQVFGVNPGTYTLRAFARGFVQNSTTPVSVANLDLSGVDFPLFNTGGLATGTITINGDTSGLTGGNYGGAACGAGQVPLSVHAFNPGSFASAFTQVCVSTGPGPVTSALYQLAGLPDGVYNLSVFVPGFQTNPPGPKNLTVSGGAGGTDLTFDAFSGRLDLSATLPPGDLSGAIAYRLERDGPDRDERSGHLSGPVGGPATGSELALGTGLYTLTLLNGNAGRGLIRRVGVSVKNGSTTTLNVDMAVPTYTVGGTVSLQGNLILPSTWSVTVSSMAGLTAASVAPTVQVYAFPLPDRFNENTRPLREIPLTPWASSGTFALNGLTPGGYLFRVQSDLNPPAPPANCGGCSSPPGLPDMASSDRIVFLTTASVAGADLTLSNGAKLSGTLRRPVGDDATDPRHFVLRLHRTDNLTIFETEADTNGTGAASYTVPHLAAGTYVLEVYEKTLPVKYGAPAQTVQVANSDATLDVDLVAAATLVGRLRDADSDTLLTPQNAGRFLPDRFEIFAEANPFVPGGYAQAERSDNGSGPKLDPNTGQFTITRLIPDTTYDVTFRGFSDFGREAQAKGLRTYAPVVLGGVRLAAGQVVDLGTVDLSQGGTLSGTVTDTTGASLANIRLTAVPSLTNGEDRHNFQIETFTDEQGRYEFHGVDRNQRYYDVIASPRFRSGDVFGQLSGTKYAQERIRMIDVNDPLKITGLDFALTPASGALIGSIRTLDGAPLVPAFENGNNQAGVRGANIALHFDGAALDDNPLGEIEDTTNPDGTFRIDGLKPGAYTFRAISAGYSTALKKILVAKTGATNVGTVTLGLGASVSGAIAKPDGSAPSSSELQMVIGVDQNFEDFVFGTMETNSETQWVTGYSLSGFQTGKNYSLLFVSKKGEVGEAATGIVFATTTESRVIDVVFRPAGPKVFVNQERVANQYTLRFFASQPLRHLTDADNDTSQIVTISSGAGTIASVDLSPSRDFLTVVYDATPIETSFVLRLHFHTTVVDPDDPSGDTFLFDKDFEFFAGIGRRRSASIPNVTGGDCSLEGVATGATFPSGTFAVNRSSSVEVGLQSAVSLDQLPAGAPSLAGRAERASRWAAQTAERLGAAAYPVDSLYRAVRLAPTVSPFSAFYDIFLPAGISHVLKNEALLTLKYDDSIADPANLNVYYFDPNNNVFLLEKSQRTVDTVNKTITVGVRHLSTFVVLQGQAPVVGTNNYTGQKLFVHNVPNPFNLKTKTVTLNHTTPAQDQATEGTVIAYGLPPGTAGTVKIEIYDVAGGLVRTIAQTAPSGGTYYYTDWDGKNDAGDKVASGVYFGRLTVDGGDEAFFKMAVVK